MRLLQRWLSIQTREVGKHRRGKRRLGPRLRGERHLAMSPLDLTITGLAKALLDSQIEQEQSTQEIATRLLSH